MKPIFFGILAAFFFAFTFILNHMMELSGGSWIWSASLRYFFMFPFLLLIVLVRKNLKPLLIEMKKNMPQWILWSSIGFGLFYSPLCFAAAFAPGWLIAASWQFTIISGSLLAPFFFVVQQSKSGPIRGRGHIPIKGLFMSFFILVGIVFMQVEQAKNLTLNQLFLGIAPIIVASFAYPLGNRKMMDICEGRLDTYQRVLGMTIASIPFWMIISIFGLATSGPPHVGQVFQSVLVAIFSGVIATILFFQATDFVHGSMQKLAAVEATQSMEVLFTLFGELIFLKSPFPPALSWVGIILVMLGMILHSFFSNRGKKTLLYKEIAK